MSAYSDSLIATARELATLDAGKPRRSNLNRAVSTAYYAMSSALAHECACATVGQPGRGRPSDAWTIAYRGLDHAAANKGLDQAVRTKSFGSDIAIFAAAFSKLQEFRHRADYDPQYRVSRSEAQRYINEAENAIAALVGADKNHVRHMAIALLVRRR